ncbi:zinc finger MYM-type protein 4-like isoform X2 [Takifugu flavidus]|uniref:zinc finger MYM-type protein 4-like isoform X2 n=1 Tax=Takifugu flavidus TaxID=433684 RepID=UPI0025448FD4|nr:zinc finger MYM-type protein 4-like isoform X2 [Takifugu flavidus]
MADSEEFRLRRLKHDQHLSRVFDEVMGLGPYADSSRGSVTSSKSGDQEEATGIDKSPGQVNPLQPEDESNGSRQEEKMEEGSGEVLLPHTSPPSSDQPSLFIMRANDGEGTGRRGGAAFDDAVDGMEDDEDWHFALPSGTLDDARADDANGKKRQPGLERSSNQENCFASRSRKDQEDEQEKERSSESPDTSHSSQGHSPDNSQDGGEINQAEETEDSQEGDVQRSEAAPVEESTPPLPAPISIKDEPIDEGYDAALLPQNSIKQIKEELEHQEEELRISSVYSVGGGNAFAVPPMPAALQAPPPAAIFIPSRGAVLQAMAPLTIRPQVPVQNSLPVLAPGPPRPPQPTIPGIVRCSGCLKVLLKGQTAFQRKGSTQLFCSTVCLTGHLPPANKNRTCSQCHREILQPRDMITIPAEDNSYLHFCGLFCLSVFRHNKKQPDKTPDKWTDKKPEKKPEKLPEKPVDKQSERSACSVCKISNRIEHEVNHQGRLHRLCSNACFVTWRKIRQLAMNCCEGCGLYCNSNSGSCQTLTIERTELNFCGPTCVSTYKQTCRKMVECANCHKAAIVASTLIERDQKGKIQLYCSSACVEQSRPAQHILSGAAFPCCHCKVSAVPQYHLAMVDGTIRNFCSYECVLTYRKSGHNSNSDLVNGISPCRDHSVLRQGSPANSLPPVPQDLSSTPHQGHHPNHTSVPPLVPSCTALSFPSLPGQAQAKAPADVLQKPAEGGASDLSKLTCHQCNKQFTIKPVLFSHQGRISMFCSRTCCDQYKTQRNILATCEHCKQEKVLFDTISYNQQDLMFCSENCKLLFRYELTSRNNAHPWRPCTYCSGFSLKMLHSHYGGRMEEFCKPHCMSQYTVLYYGMARCDGCRKQGYMTEKLQCLGSVRNFCNLSCMLHYCYMHFEKSRHSNGIGTEQQTPAAPVHSNHSSKMNPVIADVVSLANGSAAQPSVSADTALTGALPSANDGKNLDHASTQTDAMRVPISRRRQMKNKSVLCRPFTTDQETFCQLSETSIESSALSQPSGSSAEGEEKVKVVVVPVPVPVFIPVPMNLYSQHTPVPVAMPVPVPVPMVVSPLVKDMQDAAVQFEPLSAREEKAIQVPASTAAETDQMGSDIGRSEAVAPITNESVRRAEAGPPVDTSSEGNTEMSDARANARLKESATTSEPPANSTSHQPPSSPMMDLETDFPSACTESFDQKPPAPQRGVKRPRDCFTSRKRSRRRTGLSDRSATSSPTASKVNHLYGVKAWKSWVQQRDKQQPQNVKEDILECNSVELSFALARFIQEVRRPNGETYSPDSIFYLCLGIQQYLFMQGRIENIFTDPLYNQFTVEITQMLRVWRPKLLPGGGVVSSRVAESHLWECKQLGAYSPIVLLNTLLFFCTKNFGYTTLEHHQRLSFTNFTRCSKACSRTGKANYLLHRSSTATPHRQETEHLRKRQTAEELEMHQNVTNPLQCPVRLYEFYLSRCPESVKKRTDVFYLQPEQNVHTHSSHWFTSQPLEGATLESMLTRILAVREVLTEVSKRRSSATTGGESLQ